ncbi:plasma membrane fusion protein prm1 [Rhodosporidiobolus nylandii]
MAEGVNEMNVKAVRAVTEGAGTVFDLSLYAVEKVILFLIDIYRSLFLCLLDLAIHGGITLLVKGIEEAQEFIEGALGDARTAIQAVVETFNEGLSKSLGLIDDIPGVNVDIPQISIPELSALENVTLPDTLVTSLESLNSTIPTYAELKEQLATMISTPIDALRADINRTLTNSSSRINVELLPVPARQTVEICQDLDTSWVSDIGHDLGKFVKLMIGLTVLAMALFIAASALWERYRYRVFLGGVASAREAWLADLLSSSPSPSHTAQETLSIRNLLSFLNASSHPSLFSHLARLQSLLRMRTSNAKANLVWFLSYIAHPYAWAFLALGLVGLLVVQIQLAVLDGPVRRAVERRAENGASEFSQSVVSALQSKWNESATEWAAGTNRVIADAQEKINEDVFGWVNNTTEALNSTINAFYDGITDGITGVFNGTVLEDPALDLVYCLLGSKVDSISTALTWLHDNLHLTLPTVSPSILLLSTNRSAELTESLSSPSSAYSAPSVAEKMLNAYRRNLEQQRLGFILACGIWVLVVAMGVIGVLWRNRQARRPLVPGEGEDGDAGGDEKRLFSLGAVRMKPFHLRSASSFFPSRGRAAAGARSDDPRPEEPPSPAYALFPRPGETSFPPPTRPRDSADLYGSGRSWASLVDFFRPSDAAPSAPASTPRAAARLKAAISRPRPSSQSGFAPSYFPTRAAEKRRRVSAKVREMRARVEERREEKRRMRLQGGWERMDESREVAAAVPHPPASPGLRRRSIASAPASPPPTSPLPAIPSSPPLRNPFADAPLSPRPTQGANPFSDLAAPSRPPTLLPSNPFSDPTPSSNPFTDSSALPYIARPVHPFAAQPVSPRSPTASGGGRGTNPFPDPQPAVGRAV